MDRPSALDPQGSRPGRRAVHLPSVGHSWPAAVEDTQNPAQDPEEVGAGTGHSEVVGQTVHPAYALVETAVRLQGRSAWMGVVEEPGIQAARQKAVEVVEDPGRELLTEGQGVPGWGALCRNHSC